jgi:hypothetical protein
MMRHLMQAPGKAPFEMIFPSGRIRPTVAPVNDGSAEHALDLNRRARTFIAAEDPSQLRWG